MWPEHQALVLITLLATLGSVVRAERGNYKGCFQLDKAPGASVDGESLLLHAGDAAGNVNTCLGWCEEYYFRYALPSTTACHCLNRFPTTTMPATACSAACAQQPNLACGSPTEPRHVSVYDVDLSVPGPIAELHPVNITNTTLTLAWQPSVHRDLVREYLISATIERSYANDTLPPPPEWIVPAGEDHYDMTSLRPATTYAFTVRPVSVRSGVEGGIARTDATTALGWPEPQPPQPRVLGGTERTLTVMLPVVHNVMGPVTRVRIAVVFEDSSLVRQDFNADLLVGHAQAQEAGLNYYIAAELEPYEKPFRLMIGDGRTYQGYVNVPLPEGQHVHVLVGVVSADAAEQVELVRYSASSHDQHGDVTIAGEEEADGGVLMTMSDEEESARTLVVALVIACGLFGVLLVASIAVYVYLRIRMDRRLGVRRASDHHELRPHGRSARSVENGAYIPDDGSGGNYEQRLEEMLMTGLLEHQKVARKSLKLDVNDVLGTGKFGDVISGTLMGGNVKVHVVADDLEPLDHSHLLNDLDDVLRIMPHSNVLRFIGVCQTPDWLYVVFEGTRGSLKKRLLDERTLYAQDAGRFTATSEEFVLRSLYNVAEALEYICKQSFRHRNLCSYNICITVDDDVRLVTFDSTPCDEHGNRVDMSRWWAPEMLRYQNYTRRSDVWSFGCLMWECCCLGATLYPDIGTVAELGDRIKAGVRPEHAALFFDDIYQLMLNCWQMEQMDRPSFRELADSLRDLLSSPRHVLSFERRAGVVLPAYLPMVELESGGLAGGGGGVTNTASTTSTTAPMLGAGARP